MGLKSTLDKMQAEAQAAASQQRVQIKLPHTQHHLEYQVRQHPARFRVLACGRRSGKSMTALFAGVEMSLKVGQQTGRAARGIVVAPTVPMVMENWLMARVLYAPLIVKVHEAELWMDLGPLGRIDFKSADSSGGVGRGAGYDWAIVDEAAKVSRTAWEEDLRPALADRQGKAIFCSTPFGHNWFYDLFRKGKEKGQSDYMSWQFSTIEWWRSRFAGDPIKLGKAEAEWTSILKDTAKRTLDQEYLAQFLENAGQLWNLSTCLRGILRGPIAGRSYVAGVDVARAEDWMVTSVIEVESRQLVGLYRSRHRNWDVQREEAFHVLKQYPRVQVVIDSTGVGNPIANDFKQAGFSTEEVTFTNKVKRDLVDNLSKGLDLGLIGIPNEAATQWLLDELRSYQEIKTGAGNVKWSAPEGKHDDGVTSLMLAAWALRYDLDRPLDLDPTHIPAPGSYDFQELIDSTSSYLNSRHYRRADADMVHR